MKAMVGVVITILIIFLVVLFLPDIGVEENNGSPYPVTATTTEGQDNNTQRQAGPGQSDEVENAERGTEQMRAEYEKLEQARRQLKQQLARLKHLMWGMKFPPAQAKEINEVMLNAHKFEKTPKLLGAFLNVEEIQAELDKVGFAKKSLQEVETMIDTVEQKKAASGN